MLSKQTQRILRWPRSAGNEDRVRRDLRDRTLGVLDLDRVRVREARHSVDRRNPVALELGLHHRQHLARHVDDDAIGIAIREEARQAAAPRHAETARVVNDDEIDAAIDAHLKGQA